MIKSNSKQARQAIINYIINNYDGSGYEENSPEAKATTIEEIASVILQDVKRVNGHNVRQYSRYTWQDAFTEWAAGLPGLLDTCYYYNRSAVDDLAEILQETETEKKKYTEQEAEKMLSYLIYRELIKAAPDVL